MEQRRGHGIALMGGLALILGLTAFTATGCSSGRARVREGILSLGIPQSAFLKEWGKPDRTSVTTGAELLSANWHRGFGGGDFELFKGKRTLERWQYVSRNTELLFDHRQKLVAWQTDATVEELAAPERKE